MAEERPRRSQPPPESGADDVAGEARAFVAVHCHDKSWVVDVPLGESPFVGRAGDALVALGPPDVGAATQGSITWDGRALFLRETARAPEIFLSGKRMEGAARLEPGDELTIGPAHLVVGISFPSLPAARRVLTHQEFRERVAEEMARAGRGGRPTALVMAMARAGEGTALLAAAERFRAGDVVATYAHDEIEILLPDTPRDRAHAVVERVLGGTGLDALVVACAVAPEDADHPERLMRAARAALRSKLEERGWAAASRPINEDLVLEDPASREAAERLDARGEDRGPILIIGEPSAGKVQFARRAHRLAGGGALVVIACARLGEPRTLAAALGESKNATGGTLVLDEIGDLSIEAQGAWLAAIRALRSEVRVVATTSRDLRALSERGAFSAELAELLLERAPVAIPPLRQRPDDIVPLASRFAEEAGARAPLTLSAGALARLRSYPWPGNVLELRNAMERAVRLAGGGEILAEHLPGDSLASVQADGRLREHVDSVERDTIVKALAEANHNQTHAAKRLGLSRRALIYKMEKYGLKAPPGTSRRR